MFIRSITTYQHIHRVNLCNTITLNNLLEESAHALAPLPTGPVPLAAAAEPVAIVAQGRPRLRHFYDLTALHNVKIVILK